MSGLCLMSVTTGSIRDPSSPAVPSRIRNTKSPSTARSRANMVGMGDVIEMAGVRAFEVTIQPVELPVAHTLDRAERDNVIVMLKRAGAKYRQIAPVVGVSPQRVQQIYASFLVGKMEVIDTEVYRRVMVVDLQLAIENLRVRVLDDEVPASKDDMDHFIRLNKALAVLLGLEEPKRTWATHDISLTQDNPQAAEFVADLVAWQKKHGAISVEGNVSIPLPPGMTERALPSGDASSNGYGAGRGATGIWSMVVEFPPRGLRRVRRNRLFA